MHHQITKFKFLSNFLLCSIYQNLDHIHHSSNPHTPHTSLPTHHILHISHPTHISPHPTHTTPYTHHTPHTSLCTLRTLLPYPQENSQLSVRLSAQSAVLDGLREEQGLWSEELARQGAGLARDRGRLEAQVEALTRDSSALRDELQVGQCCVRMGQLFV